MQNYLSSDRFQENNSRVMFSMKKKTIRSKNVTKKIHEQTWEAESQFLWDIFSSKKFFLIFFAAHILLFHVCVILFTKSCFPFAAL